MTKTISKIVFHGIARTLLIVTFFLKPAPALAADALDTIVDVLSGLTCETDGVGNLLRSEFSHTCVPAAFSTFAIANILSPGLYANSMLRLKINDDELFPGACQRQNRISFTDQKLSFALCNNTRLIPQRALIIANSAIYIGEAFLLGDTNGLWDKIKDNWGIQKSSYHEIHRNKVEGDEGVMIDVGVIPVFPWKIIKDHDKMCVATIALSGWIPLGCKYIQEPYPSSIYVRFLNPSAENVVDNAGANNLAIEQCSSFEGCYKKVWDNSRTGIIMSGALIGCVKDMATRLLIGNTICSFDQINNVLHSSARTSSALYQFQVFMHRTVAALLTIYVIFFGFRILLSGNVPQKAEIVNFVVKFVFVVYFSVGINVGSGQDRYDGMVQWALPFLLEGINALGSWIINASPSQLCTFSANEYRSDMQYLALWDALDCRISHYLGLDVIQTIIVDRSERGLSDLSVFDPLSFPIPPYIYLLVPAAITGNFTLIGLALMYPLMIISLGAFLVNATVVCIISIMILAVLAPIFVPMYLFNYTRGKFESWVKLLLSFMLQPMVVIAFMTAMLAIYDFAFYGSCKYASVNKSFSDASTSVSDYPGDLGSFIPGNDGGRVIKYFYVDRNWSNYTPEEKDECTNSLGYILNNPLSWLFDLGTDMVDNAAMPWINDASGGQDKQRFDFLSALTNSPGMFFDMVEVIYDKIKKLVISLLSACFALYLMQHFSESLAEFAADMTEGVTMGNMAIKPQSIYKGGMAVISALGKAQSKGEGGGDVGGKSGGQASSGISGDSVATGAGKDRSGDSVLVGRAGDRSSDSVTTGRTKSGSVSKASVDVDPSGGSITMDKQDGSAASASGGDKTEVPRSAAAKRDAGDQAAGAKQDKVEQGGDAGQASAEQGAAVKDGAGDQPVPVKQPDEAQAAPVAAPASEDANPKPKQDKIEQEIDAGQVSDRQGAAAKDGSGAQVTDVVQSAESVSGVQDAARGDLLAQSAVAAGAGSSGAPVAMPKQGGQSAAAADKDPTEPPRSKAEKQEVERQDTVAQSVDKRQKGSSGGGDDE